MFPFTAAPGYRQKVNGVLYLKVTHDTSELHTLGRSSGSAGRRGKVMSAYSPPGSVDLFLPAPFFLARRRGWFAFLGTKKATLSHSAAFFPVFIFRAPVHKGPEREYLL